MEKNQSAQKFDSLLWGVDLGGTKIEVAVIDEGKDRVIERQRIDTQQQHGYEHIIQQIKKLLTRVEDKLGTTATHVGVGTPGSIDPHSGLMRNANTVCLNGKPLEKDLAKTLGKKLILANDANCLALAEVKFGAVRRFSQAKTTFGVIMGTGVGGGLVIDGKALEGHMGIAGEWGHNYLDASGGQCYCGRVGCVERIISGTGLERFYKQISGQYKPFKDIYAHYLANSDQAATQTLQRLFAYFGKAMAVVVNIFDPDVIVLGGGVGNVKELYTLGRRECEKHVFNTTFTTEIVPPENGDSAGVFGAAFLSQH